ncbi:hypothetical protein [Novosphingobium huizhouense]|uniref:hypothetical protein n=1 Tax=Novosphingobium huizhouense TaxID=2866625 RepID=UPI001CD82EB2|nr:hypothetical protein [Novosphingobium huizhouense]
MMREREIAARVYAVRQRLAAGLSASDDVDERAYLSSDEAIATARRVARYRAALAGKAKRARGADRVQQILQLLGGSMLPLFGKFIGKGAALFYRCVGGTRNGAAGRNGEGENEVFERLYPVLRRDRHPASPAIEIGTLADEEKRIARAVVAHRLSEKRK